MEEKRSYNEKQNWIIGICNTDADGVAIYNFFGNKEETKDLLLHLIKEDKKEDKENWEYGSECHQDVQEINNELYGYGCYSNYHIDYTAIPYKEINSLNQQK